MRFLAALAVVSLLGALAPAAASAATPVAAVSSDLVPALVIAGAGALVITLIMVLVPGARRGPGSAGSTPDPAAQAFRAHPITAPGAVPAPQEIAAAVAADVTPGEPSDASGPLTSPSGPLTSPSEPLTRPSEPLTRPSGPLTTPSEAVADPSEGPTDPSEPPAGRSEPATLDVDRSPPSPELAAIFAPEPAVAAVTAAAAPEGAVALADPPREPAAAVRSSQAAAAVRAAPTPAPSPPSPAPDLLAAFSPAAVLGDEPERLRRALSGESAEPLLAETGVRGLLRDHSLVVPIAACVLVGVTVRLVRARRRR